MECSYQFLIVHVTKHKNASDLLTHTILTFPVSAHINLSLGKENFNLHNTCQLRISINMKQHK